jgi:hypothetical protein
MSRLRSGAAAAAAIACMVGTGSAARAQQPAGQDVATAQALFDEGKRLMGLGNYAEACPKLVESQRIDPGGGTLYAIALCHEGEGKTATAWADFNMALAEARRDRRADREAAAEARIRALEPKLARVRIVAAAKGPGLEIRRDGTRVGEAQWATPLPIDPGPHTFEAIAPGKKAWQKTVDITGGGSTTDVEVPALEDAPVVAPPPALPPKPELPTPPRSDGSTQRTWAFVAGGVGLAAGVIGLGFGLSARSKWNEATAACPNKRCLDGTKVSLGRDAGTAADVSTVLVTVGAVSVVAAVVLWLTAPSATPSTSSVGIRSERRPERRTRRPAEDASRL